MIRGHLSFLPCRSLLAVVAVIATSVVTQAHAQAPAVLVEASAPSVAIDPALVRWVQQATQTHPAVRVEQSQTRASEQDLEVAQLQRYPSFSVGTETKGHRPSQNYTIDLPVWTAGRLTAQIDAAGENLNAQQAKTREVQQALALRVVEAWQGIHQAQERLKVLAVSRLKLEEFRAMIQRRIEAQVSAPMEGDLVQARMSQLEGDEIANRSSLSVSLQRLAQLVNRTVPASEAAQESSVKALDASRAQADQYLVASDVPDHHPSLTRSKATAAAGAKDAVARDAARYPEVYLRAQRQVSTTGQTTNGVFMGFRYETGNGLATAARSEGALARAQALETSVEALRRELAEQLDNEREQLRLAISRQGTLRNAIGASQTVLDSYQRLFVAGRRSWQEVLNALKETTDYQVSLADSQVLAAASIWRIRVRNADSFERGYFAN